jgi:hypothetical protein
VSSGFDLDPTSLSVAEQLDALVASQRELGRIEARQLRLLAAIVERSFADALAPELDKLWVKEDIRAALGRSAPSVTSRIAFAQTMVHRLPETLSALEAGMISIAHARYLYDSVLTLDDADTAAVQAAVLPFAQGRDLVAFRRKVRREVARLDPCSMERRLDAALDQRRVWSRPEPDGMAMFGAYVPATHAAEIMAAIDFRATGYGPDDPRSMDQRRADALCELVRAGIATGVGGCPNCGKRASRPAPVVQVTVALSTLTGIDDEPGELAGYGAIPAALARRIAADPAGTWRRLVTDPVGRRVDYGRITYRPPADLRRHIIARDRTCRFPTCHRAAEQCELDHVLPWSSDGRTNSFNLIALCSRHHHAKHDAGWQLRRRPDGSIEWTSPTGHAYLVPATTYPTDTTWQAEAPNQQEHPPAAA